MTLPVAHSPSPQERATAQQARKLLQGQTVMQIQAGGESLTLPSEFLTLLRQVFEGLAQGQPLAVVSLETELTTQEAADLLGFSRPFLIRDVLEKRLLPYRLVGKHRRLRLSDVLAYQQRDRARRESLADELSAQAQELGLY